MLKFTCSLFALLFSAAVFAKPIKLPEVKKIQKRVSANKYLAVNFTQIIFGSLRKKERKYKGTAKFAKPGKFRWNQTTVPVKEYIFNGKELYEYSPSMNLATKYSVGQAQSKEFSKITSLILNMDKLLNEYKLVSSERTGSTASFELIPRNKKLDLKIVKLNINLDQNFVSKVALHYADSSRYTYLFDTPKTSAIPASTFTFAAPKGVKIQTFPR